MTDDITGRSAAELARRIRAGELGSRQVVDAFIGRIEEVNPKLNAVVVRRFEEARREADAADAARGRAEGQGPLYGVPITVKESFYLAATSATAGIETLANDNATEDGVLVARLKAAGAIIVGKTNVAQCLWYAESDNPLYGRTNNPWNLDRAVGGSSGGEGAILAARGVPLGLGTDIGGSVRFPAHFCGIHSLKPTSGRLTTAGTIDPRLMPGFEAVVDQPGPMARHVGDLRLAMEILAAPGLGRADPSIAPVPWPDPSRVDVANLRIAFYADNGVVTPSPAVRRAAGEAAQALRELGAVVETWEPPDVSYANDLYVGLMMADGNASMRRILRGSRRDPRIRMINFGARLGPAGRQLVSFLSLMIGQPRLAGTVRAGGRRSADEFWQLIAKRTAYRDHFLAALAQGRYDAIVCPPYAFAAVRHGRSLDVSPAQSYAALYNLLGMPAGVVSVTRVRAGEETDRPKSRDMVERVAYSSELGSAGLPVGVQVVAPHWREDVVLAVMEALERHFQGRPDYPPAVRVPI